MSAAYEAWGFNGRKPELLGVAVDKGGCDRIHRHNEGGGITVRGGIVVAVKTGTGKGAVAELRRAAEAAHRERGDLPAPTPSDRERERIERAETARELQRVQLRQATPLEESPGDEDDDDEESEAPEETSDDCDADEEEAVTTAPEGAQERRPVESSVTPTTDEPRCTAHGCTKPAAPAIATTHPELREFCGDHRVSARRLRFNRGMEAAAAAQELRERGYVPLGPPPATKAAPARSAPSTRCPCHGCAEPSAPALAATAPELRDLCKAHRTRARDLIFKLPEYTPALARERVITGQRPAALGPAPSASERGRRGGTARSKVLRPAVAETVRRVPATPGAPAPASVLTALAPAGSPLGERVAVVRRLVACEARAGGVEAVEQLVELAARCGGAGELVALVDAVLGEVSCG